MQSFDWYTYGAIGLLALCSLLTRASYHLFGHRVPLGDGVRSALRYAPAAALTAIIVPTLLPWSGEGLGTVVDEKIFAALIAIWLYQRTHSNLIMIVGGMVAFWIIRAVFA